MKRFLILALGAIAAMTVVVATDSAQAGRLGGGRSLGAQRQAVPPPPSTTNVAPVSPVAPTQALPPKVAPAATGASRWMGPLAGLAAGIGLAALLSHFGLSEGFANILLLALLVLGGIFLIRLFLARRGAAPAPMQYAGATPGAAGGSLATPSPSFRDERVRTGFRRRRERIGNTNERQIPAGFDPVPFSATGHASIRKPAGCVRRGRLERGRCATPEMFAEIDKEIAERGAHTPTDVATLDASLLEVTTEGDRHWASVHFKGSLREDGAVFPKPFDEIWNLVKPVNGKTGWLLAGIRQLA
jgi:predicted lipid-binding transport protein (Tim44 family)